MDCQKNLQEEIITHAREIYRPGISIHEMNKLWTMGALEHFEGNKTRAAQALGITIKTLYNFMHRYDLFDRYTAKGQKLLRIAAENRRAAESKPTSIPIPESVTIDETKRVKSLPTGQNNF
jgi:hypothetical protein